jgi:hypothetical protein
MTTTGKLLLMQHANLTCLIERATHPCLTKLWKGGDGSYSCCSVTKQITPPYYFITAEYGVQNYRVIIH